MKALKKKFESVKVGLIGDNAVDSGRHETDYEGVDEHPQEHAKRSEASLDSGI